MLGRCTRLPLQMHAPLERNQVVGTHSCKTRDRGIHGLEIHVEQRVFQSFQLVLKLGAEPRLSHLHGGARMAQPTRKRVVLWDVVNGFDSESRKLCDGAGMNSRKPQNVVVRNRLIAVIEELTSDWVAALPSGGDVGSLRHFEDTKLSAKLTRDFRLQALDLAGQVPNPEETVHIDGAARIDVFPAHMRQARCRQIDSGASHHPVLDRNVVQMVVSSIRGRFDLDEPPTSVLAALEYIDSYENVPVLECAFEDRWNLWIADQLPSRPNRLFPISGLDGHAAQKHPPRQQADLLPLVNDRLI